MLTTSARFAERAQAQMRPISWALYMSFQKQIDQSVKFFTLDQSLLDGPDILANADDDVIQNWDKYDYVDYSSRVISLEWSHSFSLPESVSVAMADIVLDNHDGFFTPGAGSVIDGFILPRRPLRIYAGFGGELLPAFVGLTEKLPTIDASRRTATFHCVDFLYSLFNRPLDEAVMYVDKRTDQILSDLLQNVGLLPGQFQLDTGLNTIPFAYFEKGSKFGDAAKQLMEAELGRLYMDQLGIIRFKSVINFSTESVYRFDNSNTVTRERSKQDDIINVVEVKAKPRAVQAKQPLYQSSQVIQIAPGASALIWGDFNDPVTSVDDPTLTFSPNTSYYVANVSDDPSSTEVTSGVPVVSFDVFASSAKLVVRNDNTDPVYITAAEFWGTPAKVIGGDNNEVYIRLVDADSVDKYDEHVMSIENDFLQSESEATSVASLVLYRQAQYGSTFNLGVKGTPALQLDDCVTTNDGTTNGVGIITEHKNLIAEGRYSQNLKVTTIRHLNFFVLDSSLLDGPDVLQI